MDEAWIKKVLLRVPIATIASVYEDQAFATPVSFAYVEEANAIYFHGAKVGRLRANIEVNPQVSVNVFELGLLTPHEKAAEFGLEYESVTFFGKAELIEDNKECLFGLEVLMKKFFYQFQSGKDYIPLQADEINRTGVFKVTIVEWSGKRIVSDRTDKFVYQPEGF